ncbi:MAG: rRNA pseudouridine synthase [Alphaproteobacteria bacterium]|nr:rRNA pseudouridine synthase [Alphaproteobacteria bacterium]
MSQEDAPGTVRLAKLIAARGVASRREAEKAIEEGRVKVNGAIVRGPTAVDPVRDEIRVDGRRLPREPERVYYLAYKPRGCITTRDDPQGRPTIFDMLPEVPERVEPVGRLDFDTEGALLLTNDGELAHRLAHPSSEVPKRYRVKVFKRPSESNLEAIRTGKVFLEDGAIAPAKIRVVEETDSHNTWLEITVTEGRNRLVRRIFQQLHHPVSKLRRESFATLSIRGMERGQLRRLTNEEIRRIQDIAAGRKPAAAGRVRRKKGFALPKPKGRVQARKKLQRPWAKKKDA